MSSRLSGEQDLGPQAWGTAAAVIAMVCVWKLRFHGKNSWESAARHWGGSPSLRMGFSHFKFHSSLDCLFLMVFTLTTLIYSLALWVGSFLNHWIHRQMKRGEPDDFTTVVRSSLSWSWWLQCLSSNTKAMQWYSRCRASISMLWWTLVNYQEKWVELCTSPAIATTRIAVLGNWLALQQVGTS